MNFVKIILKKIKQHYDKLIAIVVFLVLVGSLLYLAVQLGLVNVKEQSFKKAMTGLVPQNEYAILVDPERYESVRQMVFEPFLITSATWTNNNMFVVDKRFWCKDCKMPVPYEAKVCPFCGSLVPPDPGEDPAGDMDKDGIPYALEIKYGLNPMDPSDAQLDNDGDGFTNYEEIMAQPPTDPNNMTDTPPVDQKLRLDAIGLSPFRLKFKSKILMPDGALQFGLNLARGGQPPKTYFKKLDEEVEGFTLVKYEEKSRPDAVVINKDISELTLKRGDKEIILIKDQDIQHNEYMVRLLFPVENKQFIVAPGKTFDLRDKTYQLISVDIRNQSIVLRRLSDGQDLTIHRVSGATNNESATGAE